MFNKKKKKRKDNWETKTESTLQILARVSLIISKSVPSTSGWRLFSSLSFLLPYLLLDIYLFTEIRWDGSEEWWNNIACQNKRSLPKPGAGVEQGFQNPYSHTSIGLCLLKRKKWIDLSMYTGDFDYIIIFLVSK